MVYKESNAIYQIIFHSIWFYAIFLSFQQSTSSQQHQQSKKLKKNCKLMKMCEREKLNERGRGEEKKMFIIPKFYGGKLYCDNETRLDSIAERQSSLKKQWISSDIDSTHI